MNSQHPILAIREKAIREETARKVKKELKEKFRPNFSHLCFVGMVIGAVLAIKQPLEFVTVGLFALCFIADIAIREFSKPRPPKIEYREIKRTPDGEIDETPSGIINVDDEMPEIDEEE